MKLYHGGYGIHTGYCVAEDEKEAIQTLSDMMGISYLPVTVKEVEVDGYHVQLVPIGKKGGVTDGDIRQDGEQGEQLPRREENDRPAERKNRTRKKPSN